MYVRIQRSISCAGLGDAGISVVARSTFPQQAGAPHAVTLSSAQPSSHMQPQLMPHCTASDGWGKWGGACHCNCQRVDMLVPL